MDEAYLSRMKSAMEYIEYSPYPSVVLSVSKLAEVLFGNADNILKSIYTLILHLLK